MPVLEIKAFYIMDYVFSYPDQQLFHSKLGSTLSCINVIIFPQLERPNPFVLFQTSALIAHPWG